MNSIEFINKLSGVPLTDDQYTSANVSEEEIAEIKKSYQINQKTPFPSSRTDDPIVSLVENYDVSGIEIGMITFNSNLQKIDNYLIFGKDEAEYLAINDNTKEIVVIERNSMKSLSYCAKNSKAFLTAIIEMAGFLEKRSIDESLYKNEASNLAVAETCAELAGGDKYLKFYVKMTGF